MNYNSLYVGLNACFDHREEIFIPDIGLKFKRPDNFRVFCAQNPMTEGGGRKGLPKSFLTRFTRVFLDSMTEDEMTDICIQKFNQYLPVTITELIPKIVRFCRLVHADTSVLGTYGKSGGPWEFNLRDVFRICEMLAYFCESVSDRLDDAMTRIILTETIYAVMISRMRTQEDRIKMTEAFFGVFDYSLIVNPNPILRRLPSGKRQLGIHEIHFPHNPFINTSIGCFSSHFDSSLMKYLEVLAGCSKLCWPALIVGESGVGKRRVLHQLAKLFGAKLVSYPVATTSDVTELLGSFEQNSENKWLSKGLDLLGKAIMHLLQATESQSSESRMIVSQAFSRFNELYVAVKHARESATLDLDSGKLLFEKIQMTMHIINAGIDLLPVSNGNEPRNLLISAREVFEKCFRVFLGDVNASFEWVDGVVVEAAEEGHWLGALPAMLFEDSHSNLVIENVNLCPASVLDRLNSLLEPGGTLLLSETGLQRVIRPHPNFRIFLTMDPVFGEISRALRNRCVEIFILRDRSKPYTNDNSKITSRLQSKISSMYEIEENFKSPLEARRVSLRSALSYLDESSLTKIIDAFAIQDKTYLPCEIDIPIDLGLTRVTNELSSLLISLNYDEEFTLNFLSNLSHSSGISAPYFIHDCSMKALNALLNTFAEFDRNLIFPQILVLLMHQQLNFPTLYSFYFLQGIFANQCSDLFSIIFCIFERATKREKFLRQDHYRNTEIFQLSKFIRNDPRTELIELLSFQWSLVRTPLIIREWSALESSPVAMGSGVTFRSLFQLGHELSEKRVFLEDLRLALVHSVYNIVLEIERTIEKFLMNRSGNINHIKWMYCALNIRDALSRTMLTSFLEVAIYLYLEALRVIRKFLGQHGVLSQIGFLSTSARLQRISWTRSRCMICLFMKRRLIYNFFQSLEASLGKYHELNERFWRRPSCSSSILWKDAHPVVPSSEVVFSF